MKVAVVGSRSIGMEYYPKLCKLIPKNTSMIISGGAKGADELAKRYAMEHNLQYKEFQPEYKSFGRYAPIRRNRQIVDLADHVIIIWDGHSRGTAYVLTYCGETEKPYTYQMVK